MDGRAGWTAGTAAICRPIHVSPRLPALMVNICDGTKLVALQAANSKERQLLHDADGDHVCSRSSRGQRDNWESHMTQHLFISGDTDH